MPTGIVKWFNESKGFGFIAPDEGGPDLFAHFSDIQSAGFRVLFENQTCTFELKQGPKGAQASDIKPGPEPEGARRRAPRLREKRRGGNRRHFRENRSGIG